MRVHTEDDKYYIAEILSGNISVFKELVEKHQNNVYNIIFRITQNAEDSEEIGQDVFIKVFNSLKSFKEEAKFSTWLYRIAYNSAVSHYRKKKIIQLPINEEVLEVESSEEFFNDFEDLESMKYEHLPKALDELNNESQLLISMYYQQKMGINDISEITQISASNVKVKLYRARKQLYTYISEKIQPIKIVS